MWGFIEWIKGENVNWKWAEKKPQNPTSSRSLLFEDSYRGTDCLSAFLKVIICWFFVNFSFYHRPQSWLNMAVVFSSFLSRRALIWHTGVEVRCRTASLLALSFHKGSLSPLCFVLAFNPAVELDRRDFSSELGLVHLANLQSRAFSVGLSIVSPVRCLFIVVMNAGSAASCS